MEWRADIGPEDFARARAAARAARAVERSARRAGALDRLHRARDAFVAAEGGAAARDADRLEHFADTLADFVRSLEPAITRLEFAREVEEHQGELTVRRTARFIEAEIGEGLADVLGEALLSGPAAAVLAAAVLYSLA